MDRDFIVPWALTIADALENGRDWDRKEIAAHLRRLHAENKRLETLCYDYLGELTALRAAEQMRKQTFMAEYKFRTYGYYQDADGKMQVGEIPEEMLTVSAERTAQMIEEVTRTEPEQEPVAYVTGAYAGHFTVVPTNPALVLTTGMALYTHPVDDTALLRQAVLDTIDELMGAQRERHPMFSEGYDHALLHLKEFVSAREKK